MKQQQLTELVDSEGRHIRLGDLIGKGGEGEVYDVAGDDTLVVKLYHKRPLDRDQVAKLQAMVSLYSKGLAAISAWPRSLLFTAGNQPCGILMPKVNGSFHLHELYGTTNRRRHFPGTGWHHLVLAARNTAAAFHTVHRTGVVIGDVNQGNLMVDADMCVRMIDCDSFQMRVDGNTYHCPVGTAHFTPPELQSQQLRDVTRTVDHDGFGLAVLIFHLLFVSRHPFAGRYRGPGDMTIEKAIGEQRFAFSRDRAATQIDPPPASLLLEDLPPGLGNLFERAFRAGGAGAPERPRAIEWAEQLEALMKQLKQCSYDSMHYYYSGLQECPWCRIEDQGGPAFFVADTGASAVTKDRLAELNKRVKGVRVAVFPDLAPGELELPKMPGMKFTVQQDLTLLDLIGGAMVVGAALCLAGVVTGYALIVGTLLCLGGGAVFTFGSEAKNIRKQLAAFQKWLTDGQSRLYGKTQQIAKRHRRREMTFQKQTEELQTQLDNYRAEGKALTRALVEHSDAQKTEVLRNHSVRDLVDQMPGMSTSVAAMLESFGVESAYDVEKMKLYGIPAVDTGLSMELLQWREQLERDFVFRPDHGVTPEELEVATEAATHRYKISQARKVLMGAGHIESMVKSIKYGLRKELKQFEEMCGKWKAVAAEMQGFQSKRRWLERTLNQSLATILPAALVPPLLGLILWWLFRG
ncbi:MAG: hypothetical protein AAGA92_13255 [Planctomycetota bacterium]